LRDVEVFHLHFNLINPLLQARRGGWLRSTLPGRFGDKGDKPHRDCQQD
jgi:hypothetical protein